MRPTYHAIASIVRIIWQFGFEKHLRVYVSVVSVTFHSFALCVCVCVCGVVFLVVFWFVGVVFLLFGSAVLTLFGLPVRPNIPVWTIGYRLFQWLLFKIVNLHFQYMLQNCFFWSTVFPRLVRPRKEKMHDKNLNDLCSVFGCCVFFAWGFRRCFLFVVWCAVFVFIWYSATCRWMCYFVPVHRIGAKMDRYFRLIARKKTQAAVFRQVSHWFSFVSSEIVSGPPRSSLGSHEVLVEERQHFCKFCIAVQLSSPVPQLTYTIFQH